ncbi:MAG: endonuclease VIII [Pseudomonadota bacterium]
MPEGPEIRRAADRIAKVLVDQPLEQVFFDRQAFPMLARRASDLTGHRVLRIDTRGKAMLTRLDNDLTIYSHNQLYGRWYTTRAGKLPNTGRTLRLALHTATHSALLYSASEIDLLDADGLAAHPFLARLGPDILDASLHWRALKDRALEARFSGRSLAALYLDQAFLAGVGNYLRSEILFAAGLNPWLRPRDLTRGELGNLARHTLKIGQRAYRTGGLTNTPGRIRSLRAALPEDVAGHRGRAREAVRFAVFGRDGAPCYDCGELIERVEVSARRLYFCPGCQVEA